MNFPSETKQLQPACSHLQCHVVLLPSACMHTPHILYAADYVSRP